jgi:AraC-like DNA-binding protein
MLTTSLLLPHPALSDFINSYTLCIHNALNVNMSFPLYAHHETTIGFFLGNTSLKIKNHTTKVVTESTNKVFLFGLSTNCKEAMASRGNYNTFTIEFKPNGFNKMFGISANEITDNNFPACKVIGNGVIQLYEQLLNAKSAKQMVTFTDKFLISILKRKKRTYANEGITKISSFLLANTTITNISQYAYHANMSLRNFERRFLEQIGTTPKSYCRLLRFNSALNHKISNPKKSWADIADVFSYYDTMHLIKEFKQFTNSSPTMLLDDNPYFISNSCYKVHHTFTD